MPIGSDPSDTCLVVLKTDEGRPDPKPTFRVRFLTDREMRKAVSLLRNAHRANVAVAKAQDDAAEDAADAEVVKHLSDLFTLSLGGWENVTFRGQEKVFGTDSPLDFLSPTEKWELAEQCVAAPQITENDRRGFTSPPPPDAEKSATAPAAPAATTPQAETHHSH